jgi:hypothetical protein
LIALDIGLGKLPWPAALDARPPVRHHVRTSSGVGPLRAVSGLTALAGSVLGTKATKSLPVTGHA